MVLGGMSGTNEVMQWISITCGLFFNSCVIENEWISIREFRYCHPRRHTCKCASALKKTVPPITSRYCLPR